MISSLRRLAVAGLLLGLGPQLAACVSAPPPPVARDLQVPPFAKVPYEPFSRDAVVQIAYREWRAFGQKIAVVPNADSPDSLERDQGLWQRVGEYWWIGQDYGRRDGAWTGMHDASGHEFPRSDDGNFAWSAAFISYVMRTAGAGRGFPYSPSHSDYINAARTTPGLVVSAEPLDRYAPVVGDLLCMWRAGRRITFQDLPAGHFPAHCDIIVARRSGALDVIGGNVDNAVAMKRVPVGPDGRLVGPSGTVLDPDYGWFVALRVNYRR